MKTPLSLFVTLIVSYFAISQSQDLISLSIGDYVGFDVIIDNDRDVYGYVSIYSKGDVDDGDKSFEIILLDKNLNKVSNIDFEASNSIYSFKVYMNFEQEIILLPYSYGIYSFNYNFSEMLEADFKSKTVIPYKFECYKEDGAFEDCKTYQTFREKRKDDKKNFKEKGYVYDSDVHRVRNSYSLVLDRKRHKKFYDDVSVRVFDEQKELKWEVNIDSLGSEKRFANVDLFWKNLKKSENLYITVSSFDKTYASAKYLSSSENVHNTRHWNKILGFNIETGEEVFNKNITGWYNNAPDALVRKETDDYLVDVRVLNNEVGTQIGFRRTKIGLKDNTISFDDLLFESMMDKIDRLNKYGSIGGNYKLNPIASFVNKDGSVYILTEEYKSAYNVLWGYNVNKNKDFFLIRTTSDFKIESIDRIEKDKSKYAYTDFLFWQSLNNDNNDIAFFYTDKRQDQEEKQKFRVLGVCTIIDGKFSSEELKIESKSEEFMIVPSIAKRGYIMLHEYNKKEAYNAVRLERLNY
ncbi:MULTISPECIES: hypothetical protein [Flavobacteriaceae]|uniref:hypothetical protein n=1 Tax=Flavobacteriaceae TaxID=49546 RepID=UPI00149135D9|nr:MULTISPECIES: hypothetical protein [Allomuricauda]MDC6365043.1 hypothetical protein [Muricauda sp. AC10]